MVVVVVATLDESSLAHCSNSSSSSSNSSYRRVGMWRRLALACLSILVLLPVTTTSALASSRSSLPSYAPLLLVHGGSCSGSSTDGIGENELVSPSSSPPSSSPPPSFFTTAASFSSSSSSSPNDRGGGGGGGEGEGATEDMRGYDAHPSMFAPSGRIPQIEYAREAVNHGQPLVGIKAKDGVVLVGRKMLESKKLQDGRLRQKLYRVDRHVLVGVTGMTADALALVRHARVYAQDYQRTYSEPVPIRHLAEHICDVKHTCTMTPHRPFGVSLLVAGWDSMHGYQLYKTDPSASYEAWRAVAVGEKHDVLTQRLASSPLLHSSSPPSFPPSLEDACALACSTALEEGGTEGGRGESAPGFDGEGGRAGGRDEGKDGGPRNKAHEGVLEMGVVKGGEVHFLEETDIKAALRARPR